MSSRKQRSSAGLTGERNEMCRLFQRRASLLSSLSEAEIELYRSSFNVFDIDNKGYLTREDFCTVLTSLGKEPASDEVDDLWHEYYVSGNDKVHFEDMLITIIKRVEGLDELKKAFETLDRNGDGRLDRNELAATISTTMNTLREDIKDSIVDEILEEYDTNNDGFIDYREFIKLLITK